MTFTNNLLPKSEFFCRLSRTGRKGGTAKSLSNTGGELNETKGLPCLVPTTNMVDEDLELEHDLGQATIVYDDPTEDVVTKTVPNEHIASFQGHWILKTEEDEQGNDIVRRIPFGRVHYVERSVEEFEEEVRTIRDQIQSVAENLRSKLLGRNDDDEGEVSPIEVEYEENKNDT